MSALAGLMSEQHDEPPPLRDDDDSGVAAAPASLIAAMGGAGGAAGVDGLGAMLGDLSGGGGGGELSEEDRRLEEMFRTMDANSPYNGMTAKELGKLGGSDATILWDAVGRRDPDEVSRVARLTKDINYKFADYNQMTCLHKAVSYGPDVLPFADCLSMVHSIIAHESCDVNALDEDGATPVHLAASSDGCSAAVEVLLDAGAEWGIADRDGLTPLHAAAAAGNAHVVELLLDRGADPVPASPQGWTVLHAAASEGGADVLGLVMAAMEAAGAGTTAEQKEEEEEVEELDGPKIEDLDETAIAAITAGSTNPYDPVDSDGLTPLLVACSFGHVDCARRLLEAGADPSRKDSRGKSATDLADWHSGYEVEIAELIREVQGAQQQDSS